MGRLKWDEHVETGDAWEVITPKIPCLVIDRLLVASICYYSATHLRLLLFSCRWQSSRKMRAHWTVLKTRSQTSALISEEPGREEGTQVALVEQEKVQPWTSFRLHLLSIWAIFRNWNIFGKNKHTTDPSQNTTAYFQISTFFACLSISIKWITITAKYRAFILQTWKHCSSHIVNNSQSSH